MFNSSLERNLTASPNAGEMVVTNLTKYTTYQVLISGFTLKGSGPQSAPVNVTTDEDGNCSFSSIALQQETVTVRRIT